MVTLLIGLFATWRSWIQTIGRLEPWPT